jgi:hypothetical protein
MNPEDIKNKADAIIYMNEQFRQMGHYPLALGVTDAAYRQVVGEMFGHADDPALRVYLNSVLIVNVDKP